MRASKAGYQGEQMRQDQGQTLPNHCSMQGIHHLNTSFRITREDITKRTRFVLCGCQCATLLFLHTCYYILFAHLTFSFFQWGVYTLSAINAPVGASHICTPGELPQTPAGYVPIPGYVNAAGTLLLRAPGVLPAALLAKLDGIAVTYHY